jgi:predicted membrane-bound dolichyl-phosphate-mannose-protein mannosyltransferase
MLIKSSIGSIVKKLKRMVLEKTSLIFLIVPLIFLAVRVPLIPIAWPSKPPTDCINPEGGFEGCGFIFDEAHYIPALRRMMLGDRAVNLEHPPLSKAIIWLGIALLGDNPWGWRTFNVLFSALTVFVAGLLAYRFTKNLRITMLAQLLLLTDITFFNISGFAILDPPALFFMMLTLYLYVSGKWLLSSIPLGLAMLSKSSSILVIPAILGIEMAYPVINGGRISDLIDKARKVIRVIVIPALVIFLFGLGVYDAWSRAFPTPLHHLDFILRYHSGLVFQDPRPVEMPLSWIIPPIARQPSAYYVVTVQPPGWHPVAFWGVSTPLWWSIWLLIPLAYIFIRDNRPIPNPSLEAVFMAWTVVTYGSFMALAYIYHRWVYSFYFLQVSILMAVALPAILEKNGLRLILEIILVLQVLWFIMWFPVKPEWLLDFMLNLGLGEVPWI